MALSNNVQAGIITGIFLEAAKWVLLIIIFLGLPVWGLLAFDPEKLKTINSALNRWISTRLLLLPLERMNNGFDVYVLQKNRIFGALFVLGASFILFKFLG